MIEDIIFNEKHYMKVRNARKERGLPMFNDYYPENGRIFDHELENKKLIEISTNKEYIIQSVHKHWYRGWYYILLTYRLYETNGVLATEEIDGKSYGRSHCTLLWENISCTNDITLNSISENKNDYKLL